MNDLQRNVIEHGRDAWVSRLSQWPEPRLRPTAAKTSVAEFQDLVAGQGSPSLIFARSDKAETVSISRQMQKDCGGPAIARASAINARRQLYLLRTKVPRA